MSDDVDLQLAELFGSGEREPDRPFALRVRQAVLADQRLSAARRRAWRRFGSETLAAGAVMLAFAVLARLRPPGPEGMELQLFSPAMTAVLLLGLWAAVSLRPGSAGGR